MALDFLEGLKVLDLGQDISAAFCARLFADLGARVVKVEPPVGDPCRDLGPYPGDLPDREGSGLFLSLNTNKLGVTLNLESATGRELLLQLADDADLLVESYLPSYLPSVGLDFARALPLVPRGREAAREALAEIRRAMDRGKLSAIFGTTRGRKLARKFF